MNDDSRHTGFMADRKNPDYWAIRSLIDNPLTPAEQRLLWLMFTIRHYKPQISLFQTTLWTC